MHFQLGFVELGDAGFVGGLVFFGGLDPVGGGDSGVERELGVGGGGGVSDGGGRRRIWAWMGGRVKLAGNIFGASGERRYDEKPIRNS